MPNSPSSRRQQQEQHTGSGYHPQQAAHPSSAAGGGTIYGGVSIARAHQQLHPPGVPPPTTTTETYTQQYPPAAGTAGYGAAALPLSAGYHGLTHYHHAAGYPPPPLPYTYALPTPPHQQGGYTATAAGAHFYPPPPTLPQVGGGPLPNPYVVAATAGYPYPMYASSTTTVHSPTSQTMGDNNKGVSSASENDVIAYDQYSNNNNNNTASPLKHDAAMGTMAGATRHSSLTNKGNVDGVKQGSDKSLPPNGTSTRSNASSTTRLGTKPMHLHVDTQIDTTGSGAVAAAKVQHGNNVDDMISRVKPMKSDFHFYAQDHKKDVMHTLESELNESDPVELISELNERLLKRWEDETDKVRNLYVAKEEADRTRFMNEEEIESRHCATLTSRPRPLSSDREPKSTPKNKDGGGGDEGEQQGDHHHRENDDQDRNADDEEGEEQEDYESPSKKLKEDDEKGSDQKS
jgi:hypothetical protein